MDTDIIIISDPFLHDPKNHLPLPKESEFLLRFHALDTDVLRYKIDLYLHRDPSHTHAENWECRCPFIPGSRHRVRLNPRTNTFVCRHCARHGKEHDFRFRTTLGFMQAVAPAARTWKEWSEISGYTADDLEGHAEYKTFEQFLRDLPNEHPYEEAQRNWKELRWLHERPPMDDDPFYFVDWDEFGLYISSGPCGTRCSRSCRRISSGTLDRMRETSSSRSSPSSWMRGCR